MTRIKENLNRNYLKTIVEIIESENLINENMDFTFNQLRITDKFIKRYSM
jgi:hypothetical protein